MQRAILLFARSPEAESVAKRLRIQEAASLFTAVIAMWIEAARENHCELVIACEDRHRRALGSIAGSIRRVWLTQRGGTFGERLANASEDAFALGFGSVVIAGIDAPPPRDLSNAFNALDGGKCEAAIAPSPDGGVNMIGLRTPSSSVLAGISVRQQDCLKRCIEAFESVMMLEPATDIDSAADATRAKSETAWEPFGDLLDSLRAVSHRETIAPHKTAPHIPGRMSRAPPLPF